MKVCCETFATQLKPRFSLWAINTATDFCYFEKGLLKNYSLEKSQWIDYVVHDISVATMFKWEGANCLKKQKIKPHSHIVINHHTGVKLTCLQPWTMDWWVPFARVPVVSRV